jgi:hypothetical protein
VIIISKENKDNTINQPESFIMFDKSFVKSKDINTKLPLIMAYLKINSPLNGNVGVSLDLLCRKIGYIPNQRESKINQQIIDALKLLEKQDAIYIYAKFKDKKEAINIVQDEADEIKFVKKNDCFIVQINNQSEIFNPDGSFVTLYDREFSAIIKSVAPYSKQDLLNVYLNIKKFINFDGHSTPHCYPSHTTLSNDCGLSRGAINNIIVELVKLEILYTYNSGEYKDTNGKIRYANNFYAITDEVLKPDICDEVIKRYYLDQGIIIEKFIKPKNKGE